MSTETLKCDLCGEENRYAPIVEKPKRFGFEGRIHTLPVINQDGRASDNICLQCLEQEIEQLKECY